MKKRKKACPDINTEMMDMLEAMALWQELSDYKDFRTHHVSLSIVEEARLSNLAASGDDSALEQLVAQCRELPMLLLSRYCSAKGEDGADIAVLEPLFRSAGEKALNRAAKRFDPEFGISFTFFAYWKVQKSIHACLLEVYDLYSAEERANGRYGSVSGFLLTFPSFYGSLLHDGFLFDPDTDSIQVHEGSNGWLGRIAMPTTKPAIEPVTTPSALGRNLHDVLTNLSARERMIVEDVYGDSRFMIWKPNQVHDLYCWLTEYRRGKEKGE